MTESRLRKPCELGVNVDHVATIREARQTTEPDPVPAALAAERGGADQVVIHLREDRRHIQERDLALLRQMVQTGLNLELSTDQDVVDVALEQSPDRVTIVPERREEVTTEGGLDVIDREDRLASVTDEFQSENVDVNLFVDPDREQLEACRRVGADGIELHTGPYANSETKSERERQLTLLSDSAETSNNLNLFVAAGHGLDYQNVKHVAAIPEIEELNIGHSIISRSVFVGIRQAVEDMVESINRWSQ